jgi:molybdate-binding protein/DNA-binding XRE family transcriptional regulator
MANERPLPNCVRQLRQRRGWSQEQLASAAGVSRAAVSAIEIHRLVPSVAAALAIAKALDCRVEDLFGSTEGGPPDEAWAWPPPTGTCRYWRALVGDRVLRIPTEPTVAGLLPHDGVFSGGVAKVIRDSQPERTLVLASCDPAAGLLAAEHERATGFRLLPLHRSSRESLELLRQGLVHVAGIHLARVGDEDANATAARAVLGGGYSLLRFANWDEGIAVQPGIPAPSIRSLVQGRLRWIGRENGAGARQCQDEVLGERPAPRRIARDHRGVAEAIRCGWADAGVCLRLVSEEAGLTFLHVRDEAYDLCFPESLAADPRLKKLLGVLRSPGLRALFTGLPGYELSRALDCRSLVGTSTYS